MLVTLKKGSGVPFVFLHGFLGNALDWLPVVSHLPYPCIGVNLPGHGGAPFTKHFDIDLTYFHLVGYSMGGRLALTVPKTKVASLTLISTHPGLKTEEEKMARLKRDQAIAEKLRTQPIEQFLKEWYEQPLFSHFHPNFEERKKQNKEDLIRALLHYSLAHQPFYELDRIIVGEFDTKFRSLFKNPIIVKGASHAVHLEKPKEIASILLANQSNIHSK